MLVHWPNTVKYTVKVLLWVVGTRAGFPSQLLAGQGVVY